MKTNYKKRVKVYRKSLLNQISENTAHIAHMKEDVAILKKAIANSIALKRLNTAELKRVTKELKHL
jgi:hypothetical protein